MAGRDVFVHASAVERLLESGIATGDVGPDVDLQLARRMLIGAVEEVELNWLLSDRTRPLVPTAPLLARMFARGIGGD